MGGNLCSCHRAPPKYKFGRASSQDNIYALSSAPYSRTNGAFPLAPKEPLLTSSPGHRRDPHGPTLKRPESSSTLGESGISSKGSSMWDESSSPYAQSTSAPSTPSLLPRRKPPPKPPRVKSYMEGAGDCSVSPPPSIRSTMIEPDKTSLADVTTTLDASVAKGSPDGSLVMKQDPLLAKDKIHQVFLQTREFLFYEMNPESVIPYLKRRGVINEKSEEELYKCTSRQSMCEFLLEVITSKGQKEFMAFCDSLRVVVKQDYLADLLLVLDKLIDAVTSVDTGSCKNSGLTLNQDHVNSSEICDNRSLCEICKCNNNNKDDVLNDCASFDIDISYYDKESGILKPIKEVASIKQKGRPKLERADSFLDKMERENAAKYIPVISLSLYNQCLYNDGIETLARILEQNVCIKELSLAKNHIDATAMLRLSNALQKNKGLIKFDIRLNTLDDDGVKHLADALRMNTSLRTLNVTSIDLSGPACCIILEGLVRSHSLTELDLGFNDLSDQGCSGIATLLNSNSNLKKLRMRDNNITYKGAVLVFKALKRNSRLTVLDFSSNKFGNEGINVLSEVLLHNRTLKEVNIEKCGVTKSGCMALARMLKTNTVLRTMDISMNPIGDDGVEVLSDGLKYNKVVDTLCLNMCLIGNSGFSKLLDSLRHNTTMRNLKLCYNLIGPDSAVLRRSDTIERRSRKLNRHSGIGWDTLYNGTPSTTSWDIHEDSFEAHPAGTPLTTPDTTISESHPINGTLDEQTDSEQGADAILDSTSLDEKNNTDMEEDVPKIKGEDDLLNVVNANGVPGSLPYNHGALISESSSHDNILPVSHDHINEVNAIITKSDTENTSHVKPQNEEPGHEDNSSLAECSPKESSDNATAEDTLKADNVHVLKNNEEQYNVQNDNKNKPVRKNVNLTENVQDVNQDGNQDVFNFDELTVQTTSQSTHNVFQSADCLVSQACTKCSSKSTNDVFTRSSGCIQCPTVQRPPLLRLCSTSSVSSEKVISPRGHMLHEMIQGQILSIEELYDQLCRVLQHNKMLKVLLWGNKLEEPKSAISIPNL